ncbi:hypothetical protein FACS1894192_08490 [Bacilli bacterium]|nr:hypothetical protein FACS1894192_08490 [Bacilli bacterium]
MRGVSAKLSSASLILSLFAQNGFFDLSQMISKFCVAIGYLNAPSQKSQSNENFSKFSVDFQAFRDLL